MSERKKSIIWLFVAAGLLFAVSGYRQLSMRYWPEDFLRPYLVWAVYMLLLLRWQYTITTKITQKAMHCHLTAQNIVSILYLTVRFIQDAFLYVNIPWMRFTGYFINIAAIFIPLFGLYVAFYLGKADDYRISEKWYLLLIPACLLSVLALTNDLHHFFYYIMPEESQPNLYFHPYIGTYIVYIWGLSIISYQVYVIYRRNGTTKSDSSDSLYRKLIPFYEPILLLLFSIPYATTAYVVRFELVEYSAGLIFILVLCWQIYILVGLIPVNTQYEEVFRRSTVAMQILLPSGETIAASENAAEITDSFTKRRDDCSIGKRGGDYACYVGSPKAGAAIFCYGRYYHAPASCSGRIYGLANRSLADQSCFTGASETECETGRRTRSAGTGNPYPIGRSKRSGAQ